MKAIVLEEINKPLVIGDVELGALGVGQVKVKNLVSGICGAQLQEIAGNKGNAKFTPHLMGHEGCGIVEEVGDGVSTVKEGDKVVMHWRPGTGIEAGFPTYTYKGKSMSSGKVTTFSEYSIVSENRLTAVPTDTDNDLAALLGCGLSTAFYTITREARVEPGESVMVIGLGGLGGALITSAKFAHATPVVGVDVHKKKKEVVDRLGGDCFIDASKDDIGEVLEKKLGIKSVDVIIDTSGNSESIKNTIPLLSGGGRYVMIGQPKPGESVEILDAHHLFGGTGKSIIATQGGQFVPQEDIPHLIALAKSGQLEVSDLITHRTNLDTINDAIELMRKGEANRIMIDIWP